MEEKRLCERGSIAIESLIGLIVLLLCIAFLAMWINAATVQIRVHHAITQTAKEIAFISHALEMAGATTAMRRLHDSATPAREPIDSVMGDVFDVWNSVGDIRDAGSDIGNEISGINLGNLESTVNNIQGSAQQMANAGGQIVDSAGSAIDTTVTTLTENPQEFFQAFLMLGAQTGLQIGLSYLMGYTIVPALFWGYMGIRDSNNLSSTRLPGRAYFASRPVEDGSLDFVWWPEGLSAWGERLESGGVSAIRPDGVQFLAGSNADTIVIGLRYNLDFGRYFNIPIEMPVVQQVQARAWVGDGGRWVDMRPPQN